MVTPPARAPEATEKTSPDVGVFVPGHRLSRALAMTSVSSPRLAAPWPGTPAMSGCASCRVVGSGSRSWSRRSAGLPRPGTTWVHGCWLARFGLDGIDELTDGTDALKNVHLRRAITATCT